MERAVIRRLHEATAELQTSDISIVERTTEPVSMDHHNLRSNEIALPPMKHKH